MMKRGIVMRKKAKVYMKKIFIIFGSAVILSPFFLTTATNISYAQESPSEKTEEDNYRLQTKETTARSSFSESQESKNAIESDESVAVSPDTTKASQPTTTNKNNQKTQAQKVTEINESNNKPKHEFKEETSEGLPPKILKKLQSLLPKAEIIYHEGKLTINLPSGDTPQYAKKVLNELDIDIPIEITAKLADEGNKSTAYKVGYQFFNDDMSLQADKNISILFQTIYTGNLALVAKLMDREKIEKVSDVQDLIEVMKNAYSRVQNPSMWGTDNVYLDKSAQKYVFFHTGINLNPNYQNIGNVWGEDFQKGYLAAMTDFKNELNTFLKHITAQAKIDQDAVANNAAYRPPSADSSGFGGNLVNLLTALQELWSNYTQAPLDQNGTSVFIYTPSNGVSDATKDAVNRTVRSLLVMVGLIIPTVQNKLIKQVLEDPRAIGGEGGVFLEDNNTLAGAMVIGGRSLSDILGYLGFSDAINSTVANSVYIGIRDPIKSALINAALTGEADSIRNLLSGTKIVNGGKNLNGSYKKGETLFLAKDVGFDLTNKYIKNLKSIAIQSVIQNKKMTAAEFFNYLNTTISEFKAEANGKNRIMSEGGQAAREVFYGIYQAEYDALEKAIQDYKENPAQNPEKLDESQKFYFIVPSSGEKIEVVDYQTVRVWLFKAGLPYMKEGMIAADLKSHQQLDGNVSELTKTPDEKVLVVTDKQEFDKGTLYNWSTNTQQFTTNDLTSLRNTLVDVVKNAYMYGYNNEVENANESFEAGKISFVEQSKKMISPVFAIAGPMGIDSVNNYRVNGFDYKQTSDKTGRISNNQNTLEFLKGTIDGKEIQLSGLAYLDGLKKSVKDKTVAIFFNVAGIKGQENEFKIDYESKKIIDTIENPAGIFPSPVPWTRFANIDDKEFTIDYPLIPGWELATKNSDKKFRTTLDSKVIMDNSRGEYNPYEGIQDEADNYKLIKVLREQPTIYYSKIITPVINNLNLVGNDKQGYIVSGDVSTNERTNVDFKLSAKGPTIAEVKTDGTGSFSLYLTKEQVGTDGSKKQIFASATYENEYGTKATSIEKKAELVSSTTVQMGFSPDLTLKTLNKTVISLDLLPKLDFYSKVENQGEINKIKFYIRNPKKDEKVAFNVQAGYTEATIPLTGANGPLIEEGVNELNIEAYVVINGNEVLVSVEPLVLNVTYVKETLDFNITTKDGSDTLKWTNRIISLPGTIFYRDKGNVLEIKVTDKRLPEKQNRWDLYATATKVNKMELIFNDKKLSDTNTLIMKGENNNQQMTNGYTVTTVKSFDENEGILLTSETGISLGDYTSQEGTSPTVKWSLVNTYVAK